MKVTVCFDNVRVVVPCGDGSLLVKDLMHEAILRYKKATGKNDNTLIINSLSSLTGGGLLDPDDRLCDVADDREQIVAHFASSDVNHVGGDGASSVGTNSPDFFHRDVKEQAYPIDIHSSVSSSIKRESAKRLSMHALSTREPSLTTYSAQSLPRESRRREPLGQDSKASYEFGNNIESGNQEVREIVIKNEAGPLGLHVVPCYDLLGNDQGLRVEGIEPNGRIARDGQIDLHDNIIKINGHNLLHIPFPKVQDIFRTCMNDPCLQISVVKHKKRARNEKSLHKNHGNTSGGSEKTEGDENIKRLQCSNYNLLQTANTRKIGRMIEIELVKGGNGLGFSVTTRDNPAGGHCPIYIKNILPKGAAVEDGRLRPGDRLLEVNNKEMTGKSQAEVVSLLRSIPAGGKVRMVVSRQEEISSNIPESQGVATSAPPTAEIMDNSKYWNALNRSPAKKNDVQDKVSTHNYEKCTYKPIKSSEDIVLSPRKNRVIMNLDIPVHDSEKAGLGVSVKGKTNSSDDNTNMDLGIFIKSVIHGGAASRDGRLRTNDQLLRVNGVSLLGLSNSEAMETLRRAMLNTDSSVTGVINLIIARRVSSYDTSEKNTVDNLQSHRKPESVSSIYISDSTKMNDGIVKEKNTLNSQTDVLDNGGLLSCVTASPWNPVIDRLTEQYSKNSLRNESYCLATNKTWIEPINNVKKIIGTRDDRVEAVLLEESNNDSSQGNDAKRNAEDKDSQYSGDPTYDSQLSLEELNSSSNKFSRDALGRQSMSEKRHAALDAKNTDTYKRNKKLRENRENKNTDQVNQKSTSQTSNHSSDLGDYSKRSSKSNNFEKHSNKGALVGNTSADNNVRHHEKSVDVAQSEYMYTIPGCNNKFLSPKKHWLVDDVHDEVTGSNNKDEREGFSNSRGDVKQASLNSALDDRYKRKKNGLRSILRLNRNRKSLNFGDSIEARHETTFQIIPNTILYQQKRFRSKINIQRPRKPHYFRALVNEFLTPFYPSKNENKKLEELCYKARTLKEEKEMKYNPYERIIAREIRNWFDNSKMIAICHQNSMTAEDAFELAVPLKKLNMYYKRYNNKIMKLALTDSPYTATMPLYSSQFCIVFGSDINVAGFEKIIKKFPQVILLAGVLEGQVLNKKDFLKYGKMDLTSTRIHLVQVLQSAGGNNLNQQLTHHQSTLIARLKQIGTDKTTSDENEESVPV
ncbi:PREDICTED: partitioning defective 3 homolog [Atta colombica]|uniref:partitioning defective 3 homolog n=1 Tax=Atta colombica TaxID=520822 RepID=UPI00084C121D|nr:PREDICTED: partitioning defective 3 homolog [Atta colombica]